MICMKVKSGRIKKMRREQGQGFSATEHCTEEDTEEVEWESEVDHL